MATIFIATCPVCHQESRRFTANHIAWERGEFGVMTLHSDCWQKVMDKIGGDK